MQDLDLLKKEIFEESKSLGFHLSGVAKAKDYTEAMFFKSWLQKGYAAGMKYLEERSEERLNLKKYFPPAQSVLSFGMFYTQGKKNRPLEPLKDPSHSKKSPKIALYAKNQDYHNVLKKKLKKIESFIQSRVPCKTRVFVDTSPVLDRVYAFHSGLGWFGKNTCLINRDFGSYFFIGGIFTDLDFSENKTETDHCGTCTRCLDACPTKAFPQPYVLDANRCISYWTIEHRGEIPTEMKPAIGEHLFGCDICQEVCPWNQDPNPLTLNEHFLPHQSDEEVFQKILNTSKEDFLMAFSGTPIKRARWEGLRRNAKIVSENLGYKIASNDIQD